MTGVLLALVLTAAPEEVSAICNQYGWLADLRDAVQTLKASSARGSDAARKARLAQRVALLEQSLNQTFIASPTTNPRAQCESFATLVRDAWAEAADPEVLPPFFAKDCVSPQKEQVLAATLARLEQLASQRTVEESRRRRARADLAQLKFELGQLRSYGQCAQVRDGLFDVESLLVDGGALPTRSRLCRRSDWRAAAEARLAALTDGPDVRKALNSGSCEAAEAALVDREAR